MLVRHGGNKKAPAKTTKKKTTKKAAGEETRPASTCISSPVRGGARQSKKGKSVARFFDDEAVAEGDEDDELDLDVNEYEQDGFVVKDDDDEDDYFDPPVAPSRPPRRQRTLDELASQRSAGTVERMVDEVHEMMIAEFLERAKKLEEETRNNRGLRRPIFTEAQMKQMAAQWTDSVEKMRRIPGIDADKVGQYGSGFIPLIKGWHAKYLELMADDAMATIPATAGPSTSRRGPPPHAGDVIDLLSDDDAEDEDYEDQGVSSMYFAASGPGPDDPLERQLAQSEERFAATSQIEEPVSRGRSYSKKGSQGGKRSYYRKGGGGGSRSYSGVSKRKTPASNAGGGNRRSSAGSSRNGASKSTASAAKKGSGSGIGLMPF